MSELTFAQVMTSGQRAHHDYPTDVVTRGADPHGRALFMEYGVHGHRVALIEQDAVGGARLLRFLNASEIPPDGWHHQPDCACAFCRSEELWQESLRGPQAR